VYGTGTLLELGLGRSKIQANPREVDAPEFGPGFKKTCGGEQGGLVSRVIVGYSFRFWRSQRCPAGEHCFQFHLSCICHTLTERLGAVT